MKVATKNLEWEAVDTNVMAGYRLVAKCQTAALAKVVAREHNAHAALLAACEGVKERLHFLGMPQEMSGWGKEIRLIEAAINLAEGKNA